VHTQVRVANSHTQPWKATSIQCGCVHPPTVVSEWMNDTEHAHTFTHTHTYTHTHTRTQGMHPRVGGDEVRDVRNVHAHAPPSWLALNWLYVQRVIQVPCRGGVNGEDTGAPAQAGWFAEVLRAELAVSMEWSGGMRRRGGAYGARGMGTGRGACRPTRNG